MTYRITAEVTWSEVEAETIYDTIKAVQIWLEEKGDSGKLAPSHITVRVVAEEEAT